MNQSDSMRKTLFLGLFLVLACGDDSSRLDSGPRPDVATPDAGQSDVMLDAPRIDTSASQCMEGATLGNVCRTDSQCTDRCFCNGPERCQGGTCVMGASPCDDEVACTADSCDESTSRCDNLIDDTFCDDGNQCTGEELCDAEVGCIDGVPPSCSDGDSCTIDRCDPEMGCTNELRDVDGDGYADSRCEGGSDCDDDPMTGVTVNPGAREICDNNVDDDCDGQPDIFDMDCTPTNDTCATPVILGGSGFYGWSTQTLTDNYVLDCETGSGNLDAVFQFTIGVESDFLASTNGPSGTTIELRGPGAAACTNDAADAIDCARRSSSFGASPEIEVARLAAGTYYIVTASPAEGLYGLSYDIRPSDPPPETDQCATAPDISTGGLFAGDFTAHTDQHGRPSCRTSSTEYPEAAYRLVLPADSDVTLRGSATTASGFGTNVSVSVVPDCSAPTMDLACERGNEPEILIRPLVAGIYFVIIEADSSSATSYELEVDIRPPTARAEGDSCGTAIDITSGAGMAVVADLENDGGFGCGANLAPWRDAYFSLNITERSDVTITSDAGGVHILSLASECGVAATEVLCTSGVPTITETQTLEAGTYTVGVAVPTSGGSVTASATIVPTP